jgi:hypothetical protein
VRCTTHYTQAMSLEHNLKPYEKAGLFLGSQVQQSLDPCGSPLFHGWQFPSRATASRFSARLSLPSVTAGDTLLINGTTFTARVTPTLANEFSTSDPGNTLAQAINASLALSPDYAAFVEGALGASYTNTLTFVFSNVVDGAQVNDTSVTISGLPGFSFTGGGVSNFYSSAFTDLATNINLSTNYTAVVNTATGLPGTTNYTVVVTQVAGFLTITGLSGFADINGGSPEYTASTSSTSAIQSALVLSIQARRTGTRYNLPTTATLSGAFVSDPAFNSTISRTLGTDADAAQAGLEWKAYVELWRSQLGWGQPDSFQHEELLGLFELPYVGSDEGYRVDVSRYLLQEVSIALPTRTYSTDLAYVGGFVGYRLKAGELLLGSDSAVVPAVRGMQDFGVRWAAPHAVPLAIDPPNNLQYWADPVNDGWHDWPAYRITRPVDVALPIYAWLATDVSVAASVVFTITDAAGGSSTVTRPLGNISVSGLYQLDLNPSQAPFNSAWLLCTVEVRLAGVNKARLTLRNDLSRDGRRWTTLLWRNRLGAFDSFTFDGSIEERLAVDSDGYGRATLPVAPAGYYTTADPVDRVSTGDRARLVSEAVERLTLNSGLQDRPQYEWLKSLLVAPEVWVAGDVEGIAGPTPSWRAVVIRDFEWEANTESELFNLSVEIEYAHPEPVLR